MTIDLSHLEFLSFFEMVLLVNGCRALWRERPYLSILIWAKRNVISQIERITRWSGNYNTRNNRVTLIETI